MSVRFTTPPRELYALAFHAADHAQDVKRAQNLRRSRALAVNRPSNVGPRIAR